LAIGVSLAGHNAVWGPVKLRVGPAILGSIGYWNSAREAAALPTVRTLHEGRGGWGYWVE